MKVIQSSLFGQRFITAQGKSARLFQIRQVLNQHRDLLISNLLKDIPYYLAIKYHAYATPDELEQIKSKLMTLQQKDINLVYYASILEEMKRRSRVKLNNSIFFQEIDELLLSTSKSAHD